MAEGRSVVLAGCGNMGYAMLQGWLASDALKTENAYVVEPNADLRERAAGLGVTAVADAADLPGDLVPAMIVLAVKPQVMDAVLPGYKAFAEKGAALVSVAAGIRIETIEKAAGGTAAVIRVMPNTPAAVGAGMMVICANKATGAEQLDFAQTLMKASGETAVIEDEALMDAVTAVSGSGPAYLFHMVEALTEAGRKAGLPEDLAKLLAGHTIHGAAVYWKKSGVEPGTLREQVTSPNGTTAAALAVLMREDGLTKLMTEAVEAARKRSVELAG